MFIIKAYAVNGGKAAGNRAYKKSKKMGLSEEQAEVNRQQAMERHNNNKRALKNQRKAQREQRANMQTTGRS